MALLPALVFGARRRGAQTRMFVAASATAAGLGLYANIALQNRAPFLATTAALLAGAFLFLRSREISSSIKLERLVVIGVPAVIATMLMPLWAWFSGLDVFERFQNEGLESARYELWWTVLTQILDYPAGGRLIRIPEYFAHNLWLDVAWDAGPLPFAILLVFHVSHAPAFLAFFRGNSSLLAKQIVAGIGVALVFACMAEPVLALRNGYFAFSCYFLALVSALAAARRAAVPVTA
jgi:hypothetical protein